MYKKVECKHCHKKFHPKGVFSHQSRCKSRPFEPPAQNFTTMSPHARLIKAANDYWESLYDHQKLRACGFVLYTTDASRGL